MKTGVQPYLLFELKLRTPSQPSRAFKPRTSKASLAEPNFLRRPVVSLTRYSAARRDLRLNSESARSAMLTISASRVFGRVGL